MMALWRVPLRVRRLFPKRYFSFVLLVSSVPFIVYLILFTPSELERISSSSSLIATDVTKQQTLGPITSKARSSTGANKFGKMDVHTWTGLCGTNVDLLRKWPHFPNHPDKRSLITEFHNTRVRYTMQFSGERIFGFIHPPRSGKYMFAISSDGPSELWLSGTEDPDSSEIIARVYVANEPPLAREEDCKKYNCHISKEITLDADKKYFIESLAMTKESAGDAHIAVYWMYSSSKNLTSEVISSKYLSRFSADPPKAILPPHRYPGKQDISHQEKVNLYYFNRLPLISRHEYTTLIPSCPYSPSFLVRKKLKRYEGVWLTIESRVFPEDDTEMFSKAMEFRWPWNKWSGHNPLIDKNGVESVVEKLVTSLRPRNFVLRKIHKVIQKPDPQNGDRFLLDLELGLNNGDRTFRLTEHVYQKKESDSLCLPEGMIWNNSATVYFIIPVKDQGNWVHHFIKQVTDASVLTGDTNFHVIIADFESKDIDMGKAFNTSLLSSRHTIIHLTGKFYKTLALNKAAEAVPNAHDIIFLFDLHIDVPADIMDSVRKNTIAGRMVYFPAVGRLDCGSTPVEHRGFWQMDGFGLLAIYKSDWNKFRGMNTNDYRYSWGGEDWDLVDRVLMATLEVERIKYPGLYHYYHGKQRQWN